MSPIISKSSEEGELESLFWTRSLSSLGRGRRNGIGSMKNSRTHELVRKKRWWRHGWEEEKKKIKAVEEAGPGRTRKTKVLGERRTTVQRLSAPRIRRRRVVKTRGFQKRGGASGCWPT